jgi:hypothetical protein
MMNIYETPSLEARNIRLVNIITYVIEESKLISENMSANVISLPWIRFWVGAGALPLFPDARPFLMGFIGALPLWFSNLITKITFLKENSYLLQWENIVKIFFFFTYIFVF